MGEFFSLPGPIETVPSERQMRTANLGGFTDFVRVRGGNAKAILSKHGVDPGAVRDPDFHMNVQALVDILEECSTEFDDPLFGLRLAGAQTPEVFGAVTALCRAASTFREALESFVEYIPVIHSPVGVMDIVYGKDTAEIRWALPADIGANSQAQLQAIAHEVKLFRTLVGGGFSPAYVNSAIKARSCDIAEIESVLGCRYHAGAPINAIAFPTSALDRPIIGSNRLVYRLLRSYFDRVKAASRKTHVERVEDYIRGALPSGNCSIERCAKKLGASVRTLQTHLSAAGLKFSDMLEQQRIELAGAYLEQPELSLDEIAAMLGYSEQSSFSRAFKRWHDCTPQQFRGNLRLA